MKDCPYCGSRLPEMFHRSDDCPGTYHGAEKDAAIVRLQARNEQRRQACLAMSDEQKQRLGLT